MAKIIIPLGFRFDPTDEELISGYLLRRVMGQPLSCNVILEKDLYGKNTAPCDVFKDIDESNSWFWHSENHETKGVIKKTIYVFTKLVKTGSNSSRIARRAGSGTWKGQTGARVIKNFRGEIIGSRKMFSFEDSTAKKGGYHWIMHEYSLDGVCKNLGPNNINNDIVLCKIMRSFKGRPIANIENNGGFDHIPQSSAHMENIEGGFCFYSAWIDGSVDDEIPQSSVTLENSEGGCCSGAWIDGNEIPQSSATLENNEGGYCFSGAWIDGSVEDEIPQSLTTTENSEESAPSLCGHKRSSDEVVLLEQGEEQINPKQPRICDDDNCDDFGENILLVGSGIIIGDDEDFFKGVEDIENWPCFVRFQNN